MITIYQDIITKLAVAQNFVPNFSLKDGILKLKGRIWIGTTFLFKFKSCQLFMLLLQEVSLASLLSTDAVSNYLLGRM
jgi:hypothetical protein